MTEYSPAKTGEYPRIFPNVQNCARCEKDLKDNKDNSRHLGRKYARIFVLGHYLFLVAHSFPRALLSENCSLLGTDNVRGQISEHIFAPNGDYCLYIRSFVRGKKKRSEKMSTERFKNFTSFVIDLLNNKTIILLNLAEYRLILADSAYGLVG